MKQLLAYLAILLSGVASAAPLNIIHQNNNLEFSKTHISGFNQKAKTHPKSNTHDAFTFIVQGDPGKTIQVTASHKQQLKNNTNSLPINKFYYGCNLSSSGIATITKTGFSNPLCIGAQVLINYNHPPGVYTNEIHFEVKYL
ncbi:DUF4402 domain-containing protein [Vibrio kasasachensis]|uniref:DUF4402 domain-containing protein n=1 Tax=Vibrio kasasachensis TaxID=2910248 RepID=UPI003D0D4D42